MPNLNRHRQTARTTSRVRTIVKNTRCIGAGAGLEFSRFAVGILNAGHTVVVHCACKWVDDVHVVDWAEMFAADCEAGGYNEDVLWAAGGIEGCLGGGITVAVKVLVTVLAILVMVDCAAYDVTVLEAVVMIVEVENTSMSLPQRTAVGYWAGLGCMCEFLRGRCDSLTLQHYWNRRVSP